MLSLVTNSNTDAAKYTWIDQIKFIKDWTKINPAVLASILNKYENIFRSYSLSDFNLRARIIEFVAEQMSKETTEKEQFEDGIRDIANKYDIAHYTIKCDYEDIFPEEYLKERAKDAGYEITVTDGDAVWGYKDNEKGFAPIEINGEIYAQALMEKDDEDYADYHLHNGYKAILDNDNKPILVGTPPLPMERIEGKLKFKTRIDKWT